MFKGVHNTHQAEIRVTLPEGAGELTLNPGDNRLTVEKYRALKSVPVIGSYFDCGLLRDVKLTSEPEPEPEEELPPPPPPPPADKPLDKMNKAELLAKATEYGLTVADDATNAVIRDAILAAQPAQ